MPRVLVVSVDKPELASACKGIIFISDSPLSLDDVIGNWLMWSNTELHNRESFCQDLFFSADVLILL